MFFLIKVQILFYFVFFNFIKRVTSLRISKYFIGRFKKCYHFYYAKSIPEQIPRSCMYYPPFQPSLKTFTILISTHV